MRLQQSRAGIYQTAQIPSAGAYNPYADIRQTAGQVASVYGSYQMGQPSAGANSWISNWKPSQSQTPNYTAQFGDPYGKWN